jgi:LPS-assembly protein
VQPATFAEASQLWPNYTLNLMVQPRIVDFYETVERLPDLKLSGARQEVGDSPLFYESESSVGYFQRVFSNTNSLYYLTNYTLNPNGTFMTARYTNAPPADYSASRIDTFHQFTMPETLFGWLNVTPNVGGRLTYYSDVDGPAIHTNQQLRAVFNTGVDVSFKASQIFRDVDSSFLDVHELRHIIEPKLTTLTCLRPRARPVNSRNLITNRPACVCCPLNFPITTTSTPLAKWTSCVYRCATSCKPNGKTASKILSIGRSIPIGI